MGFVSLDVYWYIYYISDNWKCQTLLVLQPLFWNIMDESTRLIKLFPK